MSFFTNFFDNVWSDIKSMFTSTEHVFVVFASSLIHSMASNGGQVLIDAATAAVIAAEAGGGTGQDKLNAAIAAVVASLKAKGIPVVMNAVNGAIEAAVADMNAQKAVQAPVAPVAP